MNPLNPMARIAAMTSQGSAQAQPAAAAPATPTPTPAARSAGPVFGATRPTVGRLAHVDASRLWATAEAFAAWLAGNLDGVGEAVSAQLRNGEMPHAESPVVVAKNAAGDTVVIVCELGEASDQGFGRMVRNVVASSARHAIWICGDPGDEYGASVSWLNRAVDGRFSMVKVSGVTIGESAAAPMFELAVRTPRAADEGVTSKTPSTDAAPVTTRRVDDWLNSVRARDTGTDETHDDGQRSDEKDGEARS